MNKKINKLMIISLTTWMSFYSYSGHETGNGSDNLPIEFESAWFLGNDPIYYCIEKNEQFGIQKEEANKEIVSVIHKWKTYIDERKIYFNEDAKHRLNFNYHYNETCKGNENLTIFLGVANEQINKSKKRYNNPTAFAKRETFNLKAGMGNGFLWFANSSEVYPEARFPDWSILDTFHGMALHEFGHILGTGHVDGTIMKTSLTSSMQMYGELEGRRKFIMNNIDDTNTLFHSIYNNPLKKIEGRIAYRKENFEYESAVFEDFFGKKPSGKISVYFSESPDELVFTDEIDQYRLSLKVDSNFETYSTRSDNIFRAVRDKSEVEGESSIVGFSHESNSRTSLLTFTTPTQKSFTGMISINSDWVHGFVHITYMGKNGAQNLFSTNIQTMK